MADRNLDEYQELAFYKKHTKPKKSGFSEFDVDGVYYFCRHIDGEIALISQAYKGKSGRNNGIESVKKNSKIKERFVFDTREGGKHGFSLLAGNKQEIGISPSYSSKKKAEFVAGRMNGSVKAAPAGQTFTQSDDAPKPKKRANDEDNYKPLAFYERQTHGMDHGIESFKGDDGLYYFAYFENGKIRMISEGYPTTKARDTGIASVEKNIGLEKRYEFRGPLKNGKYDYRLKAGNGKEIARSVWYASAAAATTGAAYLMGTRRRVASVAPLAGAAAVAAAPVMAKAPEPVDKADDYLPCAAYEGHPVNDRINNVAMFKHENGQFYFALYDEDGNVRLRSEGFLTANARDQELSGVLRLKDNPDYYKRIERGSRYIDVLYDETGREVGRSCLCEVKAEEDTAAGLGVAAATAGVAGAGMAAMSAAASEPEYEPEAEVAAAEENWSYEKENKGIWGWLRWLLLAALLLLLALFLLKSCTGPKAVVPPAAPTLISCWDGSEAENEAACPIKVTCWDGSFAGNEAACPVQTFTCWDGSSVENEAACPVQTYTCWDESSVTDLADCPAEPVIEEPKPAESRVRIPDTFRQQAPVAAVAAVTVGKTIFSPGNEEVTVLTRLGTYPEFGDSHGLTSDGFYDKLLMRYQTVPYDRNYLDYVAREIGYGSFMDIPRSAFSEVTVPNGSRGMLGAGEAHDYHYTEFAMEDPRDLEAFRIQSLNGKDIHFMKTCGNYFYITG